MYPENAKDTTAMHTSVRHHTDRHGRRGFLLVVQVGDRKGYAFDLEEWQVEGQRAEARVRFHNGLSPFGGLSEDAETATQK